MRVKFTEEKLEQAFTELVAQESVNCLNHDFEGLLDCHDYYNQEIRIIGQIKVQDK